MAHTAHFDCPFCLFVCPSCHFSPPACLCACLPDRTSSACLTVCMSLGGSTEAADKHRTRLVCLVSTFALSACVSDRMRFMSVRSGGGMKRHRLRRICLVCIIPVICRLVGQNAHLTVHVGSMNRHRPLRVPHQRPLRRTDHVRLPDRVYKAV